METRIEKEIQDLMENLSRTMRSASGFEVDDDVAENVGIIAVLCFPSPLAGEGPLREAKQGEGSALRYCVA